MSLMGARAKLCLAFTLLGLLFEFGCVGVYKIDMLAWTGQTGHTRQGWKSNSAFIENKKSLTGFHVLSYLSFQFFAFPTPLTGHPVDGGLASDCLQ